MRGASYFPFGVSSRSDSTAEALSEEETSSAGGACILHVSPRNSQRTTLRRNAPGQMRLLDGLLVCSETSSGGEVMTLDAVYNRVGLVKSPWEKLKSPPHNLGIASAASAPTAVLIRKSRRSTISL